MHGARTLVSDMSSACRPLLLAAAVATVALLTTACSSRDSELEQFIASTKKESGGDISPLPEVKPYQSFAYEAQSLRSPFMPGVTGRGAGGGTVRPDSRRNREFLEQFSLDQLRMVGTLKLAGKMYGLVKTKEGLVNRVLPGNYLGQSEGKITDIAASKITLVEIVPDGLGGYMERPAALALNE
jgi:type IV pilus assembly protein PilP